ncbi:MAG: PAS domain-containing protein, partial [candidate division WOR-3 bacterium]
MFWRRKPSDGLRATLVAKVLESVDALVVLMDPKARILAVSRKCEELSGFREAEVRGKYFWQVMVPPESAEEVKTYLTELASGHFSSSHQTPWLTRSGDQRSIQWCSKTIVDESDVVGLIATGTDITEQLRGDQELQQIVTANSYNPMPVLRLDSRGVVQSCNDAALRAFDRRRLIGEDWRLVVPELDVSAFEQFLNAGSDEPLVVEATLSSGSYLFSHYLLPDRETVQVYGTGPTRVQDSERHLEQTQESPGGSSSSPGPDMPGTVR